MLHMVLVCLFRCNWLWLVVITIAIELLLLGATDTVLMVTGVVISCIINRRV